jgi:hypothetical protein
LLNFQLAISPSWGKKSRLPPAWGCPTLSYLAGQGFLKEVTIMQDEDIKLLRRIVAGGGRKYTAGNIDRSRYDRLVDLGWLTPFKTNISDIEYQVTEKGRAASVANVHD